MLRVESAPKLEGFTEFEEDIHFDVDDPDFDDNAIKRVPIIFKLPTTMSLASVHPAEIHSSHSSLTTLSHSLDDITSGSWSSQADTVMTIEELRNQMNCCFTCGVSWADSHVSLDCSECGGYSMERPCMVCDGACGVTWKRDLSMSHASGKARWTGECGLHDIYAPDENSNKQSYNISHELSTHLEKLNANSS